MNPQEAARLLLAFMILGVSAWIYVIGLIADLWAAY